MNPHEALAREKKVAALVEAADREATRGGLQPLNELHARGILDAWKRAKRAHWAQLAVLAAVHPPSDETRAAFFARLESRVSPMQRAS